MRRPFLHCVLLLLTSVSVARAGVTPPGVNLRWDKCFGDGGVLYRDFACDTNVGVERLVGTFELAADIQGVSGIECYVNIGSVSTTLPAWWHYTSAGNCRQTALAVVPGPPAGSAACESWAGAGPVSDNIAFYQLNTQGANHSRLVLVNAVQSANARDLVAGQEYHAFTLQITHAKTVGTGACGGCLEPVVIYFSAVEVEPEVGSATRLWFGANGSESQWASWQQGYPINVGRGCTMTGGGLFCLNPSVWFDVVPYSPTPTRGTSWGQLKSLYR
jgi:hypothetical protein